MLESTRSRGGVILTLTRTYGNPASVGYNLMVGAIGPGKVIVVHFLTIHHQAVGGTNTAIITSNADPIGPSWLISNNLGIILPQNDDGWFETAAWNALFLLQTDATPVAWSLGYTVQPR